MSLGLIIPGVGMGAGGVGTSGAFSATLTVEAAFGYGPFETPTWTDISDSVRMLSWKYGRQFELNQMETGRATVTIKDPTSEWDPDKTTSAYYPNVKPMLPVRAYLTIDDGVAITDYPLFYCFLERKPRPVRVADRYAEHTLDLVDGLELLQRAGVSGNSFNREVSGTRIGNLLDVLSVPAGFRDIGTGSDVISETTFTDNDGTKVLGQCQGVADTERGVFYWTPGGKYRFVGRQALLTNATWADPVATFSDNPGVGEYPYRAGDGIVPSYDIDLVFNKIVGTRPGGTSQTAEDATSQTDYGLREQQVTSLAAMNSVVLQQVEWLLGEFKDPLNRVESLTTMPFGGGEDADRIAASIARVVGERLTVKETPPGFGSEKSGEYVIQSVSGSFETGPYATAVIQFQVWPVVITEDPDTWWQIGTVGRSEFGTATYFAY